jgi:hypothetical protein
MAKYAQLNMNSTLTDWVVCYIGSWILNLASSLGSWVLVHPGKFYWAWLCARQYAMCPLVLFHFSRTFFIILLGNYFIALLSLVFQHVIHSPLSQLMTFLLISLIKLGLKRQLSHVLPTISTHHYMSCPLLTVNQLGSYLWPLHGVALSPLSSHLRKCMTSAIPSFLFPGVFPLYWYYFQHLSRTSHNSTYTWRSMHLLFFE